jgi:hypothetical protein
MRSLAGRSARMRWALGTTGLVVLSVLAVTAVVNRQPTTTSAGPSAGGGSSPRTVTAQPSSVARSLTSAQQLELEQNISRMRGVVPVDAAESRQYPAVGAENRRQPDLYAAAFVRELLTQDYKTGRDQLLAWVQSESAQSTELWSWG